MRIKFFRAEFAALLVTLLLSCSAHVFLEKQFISPGNARLFFSRDSSLLAECSSSGYNLWDVSTGALLYCSKGDSERKYGQSYWDVLSAVFNHDNSLLAVLVKDPAANNRVSVFDIRERKLLRRMNGGKYFIHAIRFCADGTINVLAGKDKKAMLYNIDTGRELFTVPLDRYDSLQPCGPYGRMGAGFFYKRENNSFYEVWDLEEKRLVHKYADSNVAAENYSLSPDLSFRVLRSVLTDVSGRRITFFRDKEKEAPGYSVGEVNISPDSKTVACMVYDYVCLFSAETGSQLLELDFYFLNPKSPSVSPDSRHLALSTVDGVLFYNIEKAVKGRR